MGFCREGRVKQKIQAPIYLTIPFSGWKYNLGKTRFKLTSDFNPQHIHLGQKRVRCCEVFYRYSRDNYACFFRVMSFAFVDSAKPIPQKQLVHP